MKPGKLITKMVEINLTIIIHVSQNVALFTHQEYFITIILSLISSFQSKKTYIRIQELLTLKQTIWHLNYRR